MREMIKMVIVLTILSLLSGGLLAAINDQMIPSPIVLKLKMAKL
jgi:Na+-translocating ferredoxin:NAD+ oxidoreductase RnfG subunit